MKKVVYYAYLGDSSTELSVLSERLHYIDSQLNWIYGCISRYPSAFDVTVAATCPENFDIKLAEVVAAYGFTIYPLVNRVNTFEYHGFCCLTDVARNQCLNEYVFYCHSKGGVNRSVEAEGIFKMHTYFLLSEEALSFLEPPFRKLGLFPSRHGWMWHNFFWISGADLLEKKLEVSLQRHYYESFIGSPNGSDYSIAYRPFEFDVVGFERKKYYGSSDLGTKSGLLNIYQHFAKFQKVDQVLELEN